MNWDTPLSEETQTKWNEIYKEFEEIQNITLPRRYFQSQGEYHLHCFADASTKAYAAVVYVSNNEEKNFVIGKSRLVPIKDKDKLSIPRLELLGMLIGSRLIKFVLNFLPLKIGKQILWSDSQIAIDWCKSNKVLPPFVARRVEEIKKNKQLTIRHVPSELNPADAATRPELTVKEKRIWLTGPHFLTESISSWPSSTANVNSCLAGEGHPNDDTDFRMDDEHPFDDERMDFNLDEPKDDTLPREEQAMEITSNEADDHRGEETITNINREIKDLQAEYFPQEVDGKETNLSRNLALFKDIDGILRCKGRLGNTDWSFDKRYPVLIPKDCDFTNKLIMRTHQDNYHVGVNHTLTLIRQMYWIPQGKSQVQKLLKKCPSCVKHSGGPFKLPTTPALPPERVNYSSPFTYVGVDYMGPLLVKNDNGDCKRWICLFTCLVVRAVHLEVVDDLTAEEGLLALRRFISTRGVPLLVTSDNALHFKLISEILSKQYCVDRGIKWRFIPQRAPWFGGYYERLIGIVKNCLRKTLQKHLLRDNQLRTIIKEVEAVMNSRPLTCVDSEPEHILRPSDFLTVGKCITMEISEEDILVEGTFTKTDLIKGWKRALIILDEFKRMFLNQYLPSLRERYWHSPKEPRITSKTIPEEGQIVQIKGDSKNREDWKVGRIISLPKGTDNLCRIAKVKVGDKEYVRSLAHLYPLEIEETKCGEADVKIVENVENMTSTNELPGIQTIPVRRLNENTPSDTLDGSGDVSPRGAEEDDMTVEEEVSPAEEMVISSNETLINNEARDEFEIGARPRRAASMRALEKLRQWTQNLLTTL